jgi:hypothetical protein
MQQDKSKLDYQNAEPVADGSELLEEFSITELEERLEFRAWCNNC